MIHRARYVLALVAVCVGRLAPSGVAAEKGSPVVRVAAAEKGSPVVRVATYNVAGGLNVSQLAEALEAHAALRDVDVLMIQEIEERPDLDAPKRLAEELGLELIYAAARPLEPGSHGLALLSRAELSEPEIIALPRYDLGYRSRSRVAIGATLVKNGHRVRLYNVHLDTRLSLEDRIDQLEPVLARTVDAPRAVIAGDMNTIRSAPNLLPWLPVPLPGLGQAKQLDRFMREQGFDAPLHDAGPTGPLRMRLDAIYTRGVPVVATGKVRFPGISDHAALWVDVVLSQKGWNQ